MACSSNQSLVAPVEWGGRKCIRTELIYRHQSIYICTEPEFLECPVRACKATMNPLRRPGEELPRSVEDGGQDRWRQDAGSRSVPTVPQLCFRARDSMKTFFTRPNKRPSLTHSSVSPTPQKGFLSWILPVFFLRQDACLHMLDVLNVFLCG